MIKLLNPAAWGRALTRPLVLAGVAVDLFPIYGVIVFGWNAVPLVMLYWMENIIAGVMTLPRIFLAGASFGLQGIIAGLALCGFFIFHYGLFCAVHGSFLMAFIDVSGSSSEPLIPSAMDVPGMFAFGLNSGRHIDWFIYTIIIFQLVIFVSEFVLRREWDRTNPAAEMMAPYGRIIVLHFGIFAGAAALFVLGQPMIGVLALIIFRTLFGIVSNSAPDFGLDSGLLLRFQGAPGRTAFQRTLQGKAPVDSEDDDGRRS